LYAALNELRGNETDVLDALTPFFEPILDVMNGKVFDPYTFSAGVRRLYRWRFTGDIASTLIPRFERKGILKKKDRMVAVGTRISPRPPPAQILACAANAPGS
jgi:hypothetical protein